MTSQEVQILLVEDDPNDAELALRALRKSQLANGVLVLTDGAAAIDYLFGEGEYAGSGDGKPKLVLLDLKLPKVGGLEVLERLKADERTRRIPVVVLTSSAEERDMVMSYDLGANSFIVKPVDFDQFMASVQEVGLYWLVLNRAPD